MSILAGLFVLFVVVPLVELALLLYLAQMTSWVYTLTLVIVTGVVGAALARRQGVLAYHRIQQELSQGRLPGESLLDALMIFVAGALLLTPGILTDLFGFSLLLPPCRRLYRRILMHRLRRHFRIEEFTPPREGPESATTPRDQIIDSYVVDRSDDE